jgi:DNA-directed RNA polymerase specialized sigma24 family protein
MAGDERSEAYEMWLPVIGKALAYLCLSKAIEREPKNYEEVLDKVKFLEALGVPLKEAAEAAGSSADSVRVMRSRAKRKDGTAKKDKARGRKR